MFARANVSVIIMHSRRWSSRKSSLTSFVLQDEYTHRRDRIKPLPLAEFTQLPPHPAALPIVDLLRQCSVKHTKRSGAGGQHRNKVSTAVVLTHNPTGIKGEGHKRRSQLQNKNTAIRMLRLNLAIKVRAQGPMTKSDRFRWTPSNTLSKRCTKARRIVVSTEHSDFATILADVLDGLFWADFDIECISNSLEVCDTEVATLLALYPRALALVNNERAQRSLAPLMKRGNPRDTRS